MEYVLLSVCCSIIVAIIIKVGRKRNVDVQQLVLWNYPVTVILTYTLLKPQLHIIGIGDLPWPLYFPLILLLPTLFIFIALSIRYSGIVKTDVAQRMSLFIPLIASFLLFNEEMQPGNMLGIAIGLIAVLCSISWNIKDSNSSNQKSLIYPLIVFIAMGIVDILFKQIAQHTEIAYTTSMFIVFVGAMIFSFGIIIYKTCIQKIKLDYKAIYWGLLLGLFNFGNIYLYMRAHRALPENPSIVFTSMNIGVIVLGGLVGVLFFKEKLSKINVIGLILAILSIILITYL